MNLLNSKILYCCKNVVILLINQEISRNTDVYSQETEEVHLKQDGEKEEKIMIMEDRNKNRNSNNHKCNASTEK